jgi:UDP-N-acetylmuramate--alanine ligase
MSLFDRGDPRPVHFMGVAGAGMAGLAGLLARRGVPVTGCDVAPHSADVPGAVKWLGAHDPAHVESARAVVVTSAVPRDHPEVMRARELGLPVIRRAEALGEAVRGGTLVAVAGTHGKTTTTVMTTVALVAAGHDPTGLAGGRVGAWHGNLRTGGDATFVVEADEYDRSFLALIPTVAVVTNVEADHLDIYGDMHAIREAFEQFIAPARSLVRCADDAGAATLAVPAGANVIEYGIGEGPRLAALELLAVDGRLRFVVRLDGVNIGEMALQVPGVHNVRNALAAIASGLALGASFESMRPGLEAFEGVDRRFQRLGSVRGVHVVDDYAHHPTEIRATLEAARAAFPGRRLVAAFQPHLFTRTRDFATEFGRALSAADVVVLAEIYPAREEPIPGVDAGLVADALRAAGRTAEWRGERGGMAEALATLVREGDVVITLGAGDITRTGPELLQRLAAGS